VLGVPPASGRFFVPDESESAAGRAAVVSEGLWRRWLGGDASAIGRRLRLDGEEHVVVGVLADRFRLPADADVWLPMFLAPRPTNRRSHLFTTMGRLRDDVSSSRAREELGALASAIRAEPGTDDDLRGFAVTPLRERLTESIRPALLALLGAVGLLLAVAGVNLASLLIARGTRRTREMAIRGALGASRWRVVRQLVTESLVLAVLAAVPGAILAFVGARMLRSLAPVDVPWRRAWPRRSSSASGRHSRPRARTSGAPSRPAPSVPPDRPGRGAGPSSSWPSSPSSSCSSEGPGF
jgi:putative ABC transport system permease protein